MITERQEILDMIAAARNEDWHLVDNVLSHLHRKIQDLPVDKLPGVSSPDVDGERWMRGTDVPEGWEWRFGWSIWQAVDLNAAPSVGSGIVEARPILQENKINDDAIVEVVEPYRTPYANDLGLFMEAWINVIDEAIPLEADEALKVREPTSYSLRELIRKDRTGK